MEKSLIETIINLAQASNYGSVADYYLYKCLAKTDKELAPELNKLFKEGLITVKDIKTLGKEGRKLVKGGADETTLNNSYYNYFKAITPTTLSLKQNPAIAHPVSKEECLTVFLALRGMEIRSATEDVTYYNLSKVLTNKVGAIKLDVALAKLVTTGFLNEDTYPSRTSINAKCYTTTQLGIDRLKAVVDAL